LHPTPLRGPKISGILQADFVLTPVLIYTAARVKRRALSRTIPQCVCVLNM